MLAEGFGHSTAKGIYAKVEKQRNERRHVAKQEAQDMEGVFEYPPSWTTPAEQLQRHQMPKRDRMAAPEPVELNNQVTIEQDDEVLMEGQTSVWEADDEDEFADYNSL